MTRQTKIGIGAATGARQDCRSAELSKGGRAAYCRERHLPGLLALWPEEIEDKGLTATARIVAALQQALRAERRRGRAGHWTYDLNRHISLAAALKAESTRLAALRKSGGLTHRHTTRTPAPAKAPTPLTTRDA